MEDIFYGPLIGSLCMFGEQNSGLTIVDELTRPESVFI